MLEPFKWPFILIPNLPLDLINVLDSPIPFLIGVLGDNNTRFDNIQTNAVYYIDNKFQFISHDYNLNKIEATKSAGARPHLGSLQEKIETSLSMAKYYIQTKEDDKIDGKSESERTGFQKLDHLWPNFYETVP